MDPNRMPPVPPQMPPLPQLPQSPYPPQLPYGQSPLAPTPLDPLPSRPPRKKSRAALIVVGTIVVLVGAMVGLVKLGTSQERKAANRPTTPAVALSPSMASGEVQNKTDGQLDLSHLIDPATAAREPQALSARLKQQVNLADGTSFIVTSVSRGWSAPNGAMVPAAGKELVKISVTVGDRAAAPIHVPADLFMVADSGGNVLPPTAVTNAAALPDAFVAQDIASGKQVKGSLVYQVTPGEQLVVAVSRQLVTPTSAVSLNAQVSLN